MPQILLHYPYPCSPGKLGMHIGEMWALSLPLGSTSSEYQRVLPSGIPGQWGFWLLSGAFLSDCLPN